MKKIILLTLAALMAAGCHQNNNKSTDNQPVAVDYTKVATPDFNADSAYRFAAEQLAFGFRHPGTKGHEQCASYLASTMRRWCDTVIVQPFTTTLWNGQKVEGKNIIASLNPERDRRILLAAHWDSRQWADHDLDTNNWHKPLPGANDGASGIAVLMAIPGTGQHEGSCHQMAKPQQFLCRNPAVGNNAHQGGHEDRHNALHGKERTDVSPHADIAQVDSHTCQIGTPGGKFQEVHQCQTNL